MKRNDRAGGIMTQAALAAAALLLLLAPVAGMAATNTLQYSGDSMTSGFAEGSERAVLSGNAKVQTEDTQIRADRIELFGKDFIFALCTGNVKVVNTKRGMELTSEQLFYDRQEKIARINGSAIMQDFKNEMVVKGGFIEDRDSEQITIMQIGVRILKKDMVCRAEFARFDRNKNTLELSGMPWVSRKGDEYRAARISVNVDTEEIALEGDVKGQISPGGEKDQGSSETPAQPGAEPPAATPAPSTKEETPSPAQPVAPQGGSPQPAKPSPAPQKGGAVGR
jgi:lipopolysaccharide export system protein LptA